MKAIYKYSLQDKYDLEGNSHNYLHSYAWQMKPRKEQRNIPQSVNEPYTT